MQPIARNAAEVHFQALLSTAGFTEQVQFSYPHVYYLQVLRLLVWTRVPPRTLTWKDKGVAC